MFWFDRCDNSKLMTEKCKEEGPQPKRNRSHPTLVASYYQIAPADSDHVHYYYYYYYYYNYYYPDKGAIGATARQEPSSFAPIQYSEAHPMDRKGYLLEGRPLLSLLGPVLFAVRNRESHAAIGSDTRGKGRGIHSIRRGIYWSP